MLEDRRADAQVIAVVRRHHPQAQDIDAEILGDVVGRGDIAQRLGHFVALLIEHEAVGENGVIGRAATGADPDQQRGMEPATVLVRAFEIQVGRPLQLRALFQHKAMGSAAVEPDLDHVAALLKIVRVVVIPEEA